MKLHYFNQPVPDVDDELAAVARRSGQVPDSCLLGGSVLDHALSSKQDPCTSCLGPRERCKGRPQQSADSAERDRLRRLFLGETEDSVVNQLLRR